MPEKSIGVLTGTDETHSVIQASDSWRPRVAEGPLLLRQSQRTPSISASLVKGVSGIEPLTG